MGCQAQESVKLEPTLVEEYSEEANLGSPRLIINFVTWLRDPEDEQRQSKVEVTTTSGT